MKTEEEKSEQGFVKRKTHTKGQDSLPEKKHFTVDDCSQAKVKKKKKGKKVDVIVIDTDTDGESVDGSGEQKENKKKRTIVTESLNGSNVKNGKDKEISKKKKQQQLETAQLSSVKEVEKKRRTVKEIKNKPVQIKAQNVKLKKEQEEEQHAGQDELPKKPKKRENILLLNAEEIEEQVKEKKKKKITDGISITKKRKSAKVTENGLKIGTPERETCEVEEVKVKKCVAKEDTNILATPQMKGNNKRSKAASGQKVEKDNILNKKKDKINKKEIAIIDEEETDLKTNENKVKGRKVSVEVSKVEQKEPKKKRKTGNSKGEKEVPLLLNYEEVEEQSSETVVTGKKKKISIKVETVSFGTGAKKRKIKEEVEDQHGSPLKDVVFLSSKTGNADEVNINQERRQALQMDVDTASQPQETKGLGQWTTAQFDCSAQQQKFLRLLGGFKKGSQPAAGSSEGANMALGKNAQQQLQQGLLGEFERAQSRRMDFSNRGSGLGFSAPVVKKFSIDVNACRSVRFDD